MNKAQKLMLAATFSLAAALTFSCSSDDGDNSSFTDKGNDINDYETVKIGEQTWMAENLNYAVDGSKCYGEGGLAYDYDIDDFVALSNAEIQSNCDKYGRLYTWEAAMSACPAGWHLPTNAEWDALYKYADSDYEVEAGSDWGYSETAGKHLKAQSGWNEGGNGTDAHGFAALPGGSGYSGGNFYGAGRYGDWWSASENGDFAYDRGMYYDSEDAHWSSYYKANLSSVRCIKD